MYYHNFDLVIEPDQVQGFRLRGTSELCGELHGSMPPLFDQDLFHRQLGDLEQLATGMESLHSLGETLYRALFVGEIDSGFQRCLGALQNQRDQGLRIRLRINDPELASLPWESMFQPGQGNFLGSSTKIALVRYLELPESVDNLTVSTPLRMLVVAPGPVEGFTEIDGESEKTNLRKALAGTGGKIETTWLEGRVTWQDIRDQLTESRFDCFHFIGHGLFHQGEGALVLHGEDGQADYADERRLKFCFTNHPSMKLVVLNACNGATVSTSRVLSGLAPTLVSSGIPAVVAMKYAIADEAAILQGLHMMPDGAHTIEACALSAVSTGHSL